MNPDEFYTCMCSIVYQDGKKVLETTGLPLNRDITDQIFINLDESGDGYVSLVEFRRWLVFFLKKKSSFFHSALSKLPSFGGSKSSNGASVKNDKISQFNPVGVSEKNAEIIKKRKLTLSDSSDGSDNPIREIILRHASEREMKLKQEEEITRYGIQKILFEIANSLWYQRFMFLASMMDIMLLSLNQYNETQSDSNGDIPWIVKMLKISSITFASLFGLETLAFLYAYTPSKYLKKFINIFDLSLLGINILEIIIENFFRNKWYNFLYIFRLLRMFRVLRCFKAIQFKIINILKGVMVEISQFFFLLGIFIYIFALMGKDIFGAEYTAKNGYNSSNGYTNTPRGNFDNLWWSIVMSFQVVTGENWNEELKNAYLSNRYSSCLYFIFLFTVGNYIFLNLLLAIIMQGFGDVLGDDEEEKNKNNNEEKKSDKEEDTRINKRSKFWTSGILGNFKRILKCK